MMESGCDWHQVGGQKGFLASRNIYCGSNTIQGTSLRKNVRKLSGLKRPISYLARIIDSFGVTLKRSS